MDGSIRENSTHRVRPVVSKQAKQPPVGRRRSVIVHCVLPLMAGAAIYVLWRDSRLLMFDWLCACGLSGVVDVSRVSVGSPQSILPHWCRLTVSRLAVRQQAVSWGCRPEAHTPAAGTPFRRNNAVRTPARRRHSARTCSLHFLTSKADDHDKTTSGSTHIRASGSPNRSSRTRKHPTKSTKTANWSGLVRATTHCQRYCQKQRHREDPTITWSP